MQQSLQPGDQMWANVAELIRNRVPDRKGNLLPADLTYGTYEIKDLSSGNGSLTEGSLALDKTWGNVIKPQGGTCCSYSGIGWNPDTFELVIDGTDFGDITGVDSCGGGNEDISPLFNSFASASAAIATVASPGTVSGVSAGTTTASATGVVFYGEGDYCTAREVEVTAPVTVCDFAISPASFTAGSCTNGAEQNQGFAVNFTPASCVTSYGGQGTCNATVAAGSDIEIAVGGVKCNFSSAVPPSATVQYFAGPPLASGNAGVINMSFTVNFPDGSVSHTDAATVACP
jgi:hypothetical protein